MRYVINRGQISEKLITNLSEKKKHWKCSIEEKILKML